MKNERRELVERLVNYGYIESEEVKNAMLKVPREEFLPRESKEYAYIDQPLPIGKGQTISAPHMVAMICEKLAFTNGMNVLEIGAGFGYNAAVVAEIIGSKGHLYTIERIESLARIAEDNLKRTGYGNVKVLHLDGSKGYPDKAPYDRIYLTASAPSIPSPLKSQLKIKGRLLAPIGKANYLQELVCLVKLSETEFKEHNLGGVAFVPLIGEHGWSE